MALILGVETSCDETSIAVIRGDEELALVTRANLEGQAEYGGVVPEIAARQHIAVIGPVYEQALARARVRADDLDAIAVTYGPGLAGSLIVGLNLARGLATGLGIPLLAVNHLEAHVLASWIGRPATDLPELPAVCLVVSGGHTDLTLMRTAGRHELLGRTRDDAAGEAVDKVARVLELGFPGGPAIQKAAGELPDGSSKPYALPRAWLRDTYDFSFSGVKTAVYRAWAGKLGPAEEQRIFRGEGDEPLREREPAAIARMAAGFQEAVVDVLVGKTAVAAEEFAARSVILAGGVAANLALREALTARLDIPLFLPAIRHCMDNGAMIAMAGARLLQHGQLAPDDLDIDPGLELTARELARPAD
ncbi:MAG: tRNA (adenosine(37)-N6)-threonylcarbamoyltransferase complex transferase subunit TsaD [Chloroflexota bacterium]|nr:tRNA (adenosine(37)-N6)-threonylcarbamoyltransferase complex transferase subunit TsaD [Chloroflexota bacterium]